ncbi:MAG: TolC family protein [Spirochaetaceae bacterium]|jgi:outer membrane protein TolC|nr:TolC family protein [Spirochaetaceae bacterium]
MQYKIVKLLFILFVLFAWFAWFAVNLQALSLEEAEKLALSASPELRKYNLIEENNSLKEKGDLFNRLPSLGSLRVSGESDLKDTVQGTLSLPSSISATLWDGGVYSITKQLNAITSESTKNSVLQAYYDVLSGVATSYYDVLEAQTTLENAKADLENQEINWEKAEVQYQSKMLGQGDYLQAEFDYADAKTALNKAGRDLAAKKTVLQKLLGLSEDLPELSDINFDAYIDFLQTLAAYDDAAIASLKTKLLSLVQTRNPGFLNAGLNLKQSELGLKQAQTGYMPNFQASFSFPSPSVNLNTTDINNNSVLQWSKMSLGISGSISLDFWKTANSVARSKNSLAQQQIDYQSTVDQLDTDVYNAIISLINNATSVVSTERALEIRQIQYDSAEALYNLGQYSSLDLSEARINFNQSQAASNTARYSFLKQLATIRGLAAFNTMPELVSFISK